MSVFTNPFEGAPGQAAAYSSAIVALLRDRDPIDVLRLTADKLDASLRGLSEEEMRRPEAPGKWSLCQVLRHLADSEIVWGWRIRLVLAQDRPSLTGYDQDAWAERLRYDEADPVLALKEFRTVREGNLRVLAGLTSDDLQRVGVHAERGEQTLAHMLKLHAGHDLLHLIQIDRIRTSGS
jgi:uncharacterized damage-inducible protein DinB